ncbi:MAG TPA: hypothetical protein GX505_11035 [Clostridiales bacterium]|nr:hypothetical protein [Clostridiales bacterium]
MNIVSHAGIAKNCLNPLDEANGQGLLWNRGEIKNIGKIQVIGHTPCKNDEPVYDEKITPGILILVPVMVVT